MENVLQCLALETADYVFLGLWIVALPLMAWTGSWRPRTVLGRERWPAGQGAMLLLAGILLGFSAYIVAAQFYGAIHGRPASPATQQTHPIELSPADEAAIAAIGPIAGLCAIVLLHRMSKHRSLQLLGMQVPWPKIGWGMFIGLVSMLIVFPVVQTVGMVSEYFYQMYDIEHSPEHQLLEAYRELGGFGYRLLIIFAAVVMAPLFEELVFRAHLQTLLLRGFEKMFGQRVTIQVAEPYTPPGGYAPMPEARPGAVLSYLSLPGLGTNEPLAGWRGIAARWCAVVITSLLFAAVHPWWSWPMIFVLSLCLGYVYERTGNLWSNITLHALFNGVQVTLFILISGRG